MHNHLPNCLLSFTILVMSSAHSTENNTQDSDPFTPSKITYPLPTVKVTMEPGIVFEFCVVPLDIGDAPFATREFWLGGRGIGGFKEPPTRCLIAGAVVMPLEKNQDWCLLVGQKEVTVAQWNSVLGLPAPVEIEAQLPITKVSIAEVTLFIEKANEKMRRQELSKIIDSPFSTSFDHVFLRLPTEEEWEFSARGGCAVDSTHFDKPNPYGRELNRYEWSSEQNSSKGKLKPVGLLKPNPLGIHDMLGNAAEMACGLYRIEYSQGRFGGVVIRGCDFRTSANELSSSRRTEESWVKEDGTAFRSSTVGFRLVMGSTILTSMAKIDELNTAWDKYVATRIQPATSVSATASVAQASGQELQEMDRLTKALAKNVEQDSGKSLLTKEALSQMETQIASLQGRLNAAEEKSSIVAVRLASIISQESISNGVKKLQAEGDSNLSALNKQNKIHTCEVKLGEAAKVMQESCDMLAEFSKPSVEKAFTFQLKRIVARIGSEKDPEIKAALNRQKAATEIARKTALDYVQYRRRSLDEWMGGLMEISRDWLKELNR